MGLELLDTPFPAHSSHSPVMAPSQATSHQGSHKLEEELICASTDLCLGQGCQSGI